MSGVFSGSNSLEVFTYGPGTLSLLTFGGVASNLPNVIGGKQTTSIGTTPWMVGYSHNYRDYAFIWEGTGTGGSQAVYRIGSSTATQSVGTSWSSASLAVYGNNTITTADVTAQIAGAANRDNDTTFWVIPDLVF